MSVKECRKCGLEKPLTDFYADARYRGGHHHQCKACALLAKRAWERGNPEKVQAAHHRRKYGLTPEALDALVEQQGGACALPSCETSWEAVDHDHGTGRVRGLLCKKHNTALGGLGDTASGVAEALAYLEGRV